MKTMIVYLSLTENTDKVARQISSKLGNCSLKKIEVKTRIPNSVFFRIFKFGFFQTFGITPKYSIKLDDNEQYDLIILGSPVWMGRVAPPILDVVRRHFKAHNNFALFSTYKTDINQLEERLRKDAGLTQFISTLHVKSPVKEADEEVQHQINQFVSRITKNKDIIMGQKTHLSEVIKGPVQSHLN